MGRAAVRLLAALATIAPAAVAMGTAVLINATDVTWRVRMEDCPLSTAPFSLTLRRNQQAGEPILALPGAAERPELRLEPCWELHLSHGEPSVGPVRGWFEILSEPSGDSLRPVVLEGYLFCHTYVTLLGWRPWATSLSGAFYDTGQPNPFRFSPEPGATVILEPAPPGPGCVIL